MYVCMCVCTPTDDCQIKKPDLTCLYQINVQARSLGTQILTNARKYVSNEIGTGETHLTCDVKAQHYLLTKPYQLNIVNREGALSSIELS